MYEALKATLLPLLKVPAEPPRVPADRHSRVDTFRAAPAFLSYRYFQLAVWLAFLFMPFAFAAAGLAVIGGCFLAPVVLAIFFVKAAILYAATRLEYELRYYVVTDRSLRVREGVFTIREMTLTFVNVQNVSIEQGPIERWLGIANVRVDTAGGGARADKPGGMASSHRAVLRGISNAAEVRDLIRSCLERAHRQAGLGDAEDEARSPAAGFGAEELALLAEIRAETRALAALG